MVVCQIMRYFDSFLLGLNCTFQLYSSWLFILWYVYRYHATLCIGQLQLITVYRTDFGCTLFWCWVSLCVPFTNPLIAYYPIMTLVTIIGMFMSMAIQLDPHVYMLSETRSFSFCNYAPGCFCPWIFYIGLNMLSTDSFMSCLHFLLEYFTGEFQDLQLIVLAMFGSVD